ncbi:Palmitoyltransferase, partial [Ceratobasidium sp. 395]
RLTAARSIYHFYCVASNQTTIEGWEKDKVATLIRRGKIRELKFPYHLGALTNFRAVLGERVWLWCWPQRMRGSGLSFPVAEGTGKWIEFHKDRDRDHGSSTRHENGWSSTDADVDEGGTSGSRGGGRLRAVEEEGEMALSTPQFALDFILTLVSLCLDPDVQYVWPPKEPGIYKDRSLAAASALQDRLKGSPWTYGNDGPNPTLRARNQSDHPPYHPSYQPQNDSNDPDRQFDHEYDDSTNSSPSRASSDYDVDQSSVRDVRVRRGSEGWEVRPMTNEEIVARYTRSRGIHSAEDEEVAPLDLDGQENGWDLDPPDAFPGGESDFVEITPTRYNTYIPETPDSSEDEALGTHVATYADE